MSSVRPAVELLDMEPRVDTGSLEWPWSELALDAEEGPSSSLSRSAKTPQSSEGSRWSALGAAILLVNLARFDGLGARGALPRGFVW